MNRAPTPGDDAALLAELLALPEAEWGRVTKGLSDRQLRELRRRWTLWSHTGQLAPAGDWRVWLIRAGRGFGKTRAGAEWVSEVARTTPKAAIALVGATVQDAVKVMVEGPSGLIAVARDDEPIRWRASAGVVKFASGATAHVYSAEAPEKLRGPEHHAAWCDELGKWRDGAQWGGAAWDNLMLGLRGGDDQRCVVTTTPQSTPLMRRVMAAAGTIETHGRTHDNVHLAAGFLAAMTELYGGTRLGRQELDGELIDDAEGALWTRAMIEECRVAGASPAELGLVRVVVGVDPPAGLHGDACGIVACGVDAAGTGYVLGDASVRGASPERWARAVAGCAARHGADRVVAEKNNGGEMVRSVLSAADAALPVRLVHASRGKSARAEPVAARYECGRVKHVGAFPALEDELCGLQAGGGYAGPGRSPDRADACVWALTDLLLERRPRPMVRDI